ncbi:MAG: cytosine deaminase [Lachnospiraceae bacterium]|nr:cytosine deaminase [Lachnospiraceae bacterium]
MTSLIKNVFHPIVKHRTNIVLENGKIKEIKSPEDLLQWNYDEVVEGEGYTILPSLIDSHAHLDKTVWGMEWFENKLGYHITDRIDNERTARKTLGLDAYTQACRYIELSLSLGVQHMRSHVDVDTQNGLEGLEGVMQAAKEYKDLFDVELVAFPQSGVIIRPGTYELLDQALAMGADIIGGLDPAAIDRDPKGSLDAVFNLAQKHAKPVDIHLHEAAELGAFDMELIIERTKALGMQGLVSISHAFCLGADEALVNPLLEKLHQQNITIITAAQPGAASIPSVKALIHAGVNICGGNDNVRDLWSPFGSGDILERAALIAMKNGFRRDEDLALAMELCTTRGARLMDLKDYGITEGCSATFLLVKARNLSEAIVSYNKDRIVFREGKIIRKSPALSA